MTPSSEVPGFYKKKPSERLEFVKKFADSHYNDFQFNEKHYDEFMLKYFSGTKPENFEKAIDEIIS